MSIYHQSSAYVYKVTNKETSEFYIGSCTNIEARTKYTPINHFLIKYFTSGPWKNQLMLDSSKFISEIIFQSNFTVLNVTNNKDEFVAYWYEQLLIHEYIKRDKNPLCINKHCINPNNYAKEFGTQGKKSSKETCSKISIANTGKTQSVELIERRIAPLRGRRYKNPKMSEVKTGKKRIKFTEEACSNMALAQVGKIKSSDAKSKMSDKRKGTISVLDITLMKFVHITTEEYHSNKDRYKCSGSNYVKDLKSKGII